MGWVHKMSVYMTDGKKKWHKWIVCDFGIEHLCRLHHPHLCQVQSPRVGWIITGFGLCFLLSNVVCNGILCYLDRVVARGAREALVCRTHSAFCCAWVGSHSATGQCYFLCMVNNSVFRHVSKFRGHLYWRCLLWEGRVSKNTVHLCAWFRQGINTSLMQCN